MHWEPGTHYRLSLECSVHPQDCLEVVGRHSGAAISQEKWELEDKGPSFLASWIYQFWYMFSTILQVSPEGLSLSHPPREAVQWNQILILSLLGKVSNSRHHPNPPKTFNLRMVPPCSDLRGRNQTGHTRKRRDSEDLLQDSCYQFSLFQIENMIMVITYQILLDLFGSCCHRHLSSSIISLLLDHTPFPCLKRHSNGSANNGW